VTVWSPVQCRPLRGCWRSLRCRLKPWKTETFKISNDPEFERKLIDVVGLYLNPPERAVVFSFGEKSQVQALDRPAQLADATGTGRHDDA
jgi:hypothetical protein